MQEDMSSLRMKTADLSARAAIAEGLQAQNERLAQSEGMLLMGKFWLCFVILIFLAFLVHFTLHDMYWLVQSMSHNLKMFGRRTTGMKDERIRHLTQELECARLLSGAASALQVCPGCVHDAN